MTTVIASSTPGHDQPSMLPTRRRKAHRKSRLGCGNCKIRSIKCDESKPSCRRCEASGFTCNYSHSAPTLQLAHAGVFRFDLSSSDESSSNGSLKSHARRTMRWEDVKLLWEPVLMAQTRIPVLSPTGGESVDYILKPNDYAILDRFHKRTMNTFGDAKMRGWYGQAMLRLARSHPFLFHIFIAISLLHDTHLSPSTPSTPSHRSSLAFHWYHGTAIFKRLLAQPDPTTTLSSTQRDALWVAASLLGAASFAGVNTTDPRAAWPLKEPEPVDLDWLKMGHGKRVVLAITDPSRPESAFHRIHQDHLSHPSMDGTDAIDPHILPPLFYPVFNLTADSSPATNPYHTPACMLSALWHEPLSDDNIINYLSFITQIDIKYRTLVEEKDPLAMLLMFYWHSMICSHHMWWLQRRSIVEGLAICIYLEEHCANDPDIMDLIQMPKAKLLVAVQSYGLYANI